MTWKPAPRPDVDPCELPLDAQQGFLLSRLDGAADVPALAAMLGVEPAQVEDLLEGLVRVGAIDPAPSSERRVPAEASRDESSEEALRGSFGP